MLISTTNNLLIQPLQLGSDVFWHNFNEWRIFPPQNYQDWLVSQQPTYEDANNPPDTPQAPKRAQPTQQPSPPSLEDISSEASSVFPFVLRKVCRATAQLRVPVILKPPVSLQTLSDLFKVQRRYEIPFVNGVRIWWTGNSA